MFAPVETHHKTPYVSCTRKDATYQNGRVSSALLKHHRQLPQRYFVARAPIKSADRCRFRLRPARGPLLCSPGALVLEWSPWWRLGNLRQPRLGRRCDVDGDGAVSSSRRCGGADDDDDDGASLDRFDDRQLNISSELITCLKICNRCWQSRQPYDVIRLLSIIIRAYLHRIL